MERALAWLAIMALCGCTDGPPPPAGKPPRAVMLNQPGTLGSFDPSLQSAFAGLAHSLGTQWAVWLSYSSAAPSSMFANPGPMADRIRISTRLALSSDEGATFADVAEVNPAMETPLPAPINFGIWQYEVSSLVFDAGAPAAEQWKLFALRYLEAQGARLNQHLWIALRTASDPRGTWSAERKLFTGSIYDTVDDDPIVGPPEVKLNLLYDDAGHAVLSDCAAFAEPGALSKPDGLYLALNCATGGANDRIVLIKLTHPAETWSYVGVLLGPSDAPHGYVGLSAADLFTLGGKDHVVVSPVDAQGLYRGCLVYDFSAIAQAQLVRANGAPVTTSTVPDAGAFLNGACTYDAGATVPGVLFFERPADFPATPISIYASFVNP
jgi:hypothetical protein